MGWGLFVCFFVSVVTAEKIEEERKKERSK